MCVNFHPKQNLKPCGARAALAACLQFDKLCRMKYVEWNMPHDICRRIITSSEEIIVFTSKLFYDFRLSKETVPTFNQRNPITTQSNSCLISSRSTFHQTSETDAKILIRSNNLSKISPRSGQNSKMFPPSFCFRNIIPQWNGKPYWSTIFSFHGVNQRPKFANGWW